MKDKSDENWGVGCRCLEEGNCNSAASRLYYSAFQAVLRYARKRESYKRMQSRSVHADMAEVVGRVGVASKYFGRRFIDLKALRETADYEPDTPPKEEIEELQEDCDKIRQFFLRSS